MSTLREKLTTASKLVIQAVVGSACVGYFAYHALQGDSGFRELATLQHEVNELETKHDKLVTERERMEQLTQRLHSESLDPDLLDERVRKVLQYTKPNEYVVMLGPDGLAAQTAEHH
jgi:cell division protein FtsB